MASPKINKYYKVPERFSLMGGHMKKPSDLLYEDSIHKRERSLMCIEQIDRKIDE